MQNKHRKGVGLWVLLLWLASMTYGWAKPVTAPHIEVELVSANRSVAPGGSVWVGVRQKIESHWHTYWQNPGDSGLAPKMRWSLPKSVQVGALRWPIPHRIRVKHLVNFGYEKRVLLMAKMSIPSNFSAKEVVLKGEFSWLVCKEECIPGKATLSLRLSVQKGPATPTKWAPWFQQTQTQHPQENPAPAFFWEVGGIVHVVLSGIPAHWNAKTSLELFPVDGSVVENGNGKSREMRSNGLVFRFAKNDYFSSRIRTFRAVVATSGHEVSKGWRWKARRLAKPPTHWEDVLPKKSSLVVAPQAKAASHGSKVQHTKVQSAKGSERQKAVRRLLPSTSRPVALGLHQPPPRPILREDRAPMDTAPLERMRPTNAKPQQGAALGVSPHTPKQPPRVVLLRAGTNKSRQVREKTAPQAQANAKTYPSGSAVKKSEKQGDSAKRSGSQAKSGVVAGTLKPRAALVKSSSREGESLSFWTALWMALLGGMLLNLMPCVFPVLSIKILHFVEQAHEEPKKTRRHGLAFLAGVLVSFSLLSGALLALRASGFKMGWGFQFQSPTGVLALAVVLFLVGLSLSGVFEFGSSWMNLGNSLASRSGYQGSFFSGILATVVSTPCIGPLMGAAIAYALTQPTWAGMLLLNTVGLGMALPYVLLSWFPQGLRWLPRPGAWMETLKQAMAFPMYAVVIWLLWGLRKKTGADGIITALEVLLACGFGAWLWGRAGWTPWKQRIGLGLFVVFGLGSMVWGHQTLAREQSAYLAAQKKHLQSPSSSAFSKGKGLPAWKAPFSPERLRSLLAKDQIVFVNMTADWCLSCKINEKVALRSTKIREAFAKRGVHYLVGDWTNGDPAITKVLESFKRAGVPLYVFFLGKSGKTKVLPQILTPSIVLKALQSI